MKCKHQRTKAIFTHGKKGKSYLVCKHCGEIVKKHELKKQRQSEKRRR